MKKIFTAIFLLALIPMIYSQSEPRQMTKARLFKSKGQFNECLKLMDEVIAEQPDFAGARFYRGEVLFEMENYSEAIKDFANGIKILNLKTMSCRFK